MIFGDAVAGFEITHQPGSFCQLKVLGENFLALASSHLLLSGDSRPESFQMKRPELFRKVISEFKRSSLEILHQRSIPLSKIAYYLLHQANQRIIERAARAIGFTREQTLFNVA